MTENYTYSPEPFRFDQTHLNLLLQYCHRIDASDITLQTDAPVFAEIYGKLFKITQRKLSNAEVGNMLNAIYGPNGTTQILSGIDIDTHYEIRPNRSERFRYRVNGTGCMVNGHDAIQITLRSIPTTPPKLADLNLPKEFIAAIAPPDGIVFVTGPTGSGKTTLLAAIIRELVEQTESHRKVLTYEAPIEFVFDEIQAQTALVSQSEIPRHLPSFAAGIRNALRRKPRLIMVGECRDSQTISAALEAALTGHPVYTTLHTSGVAESLRRLITTFPAEERQTRAVDLIETMRVCIWQKLVPSVNGKRIALREYLIFNETIRNQMLTSDFSQMTTTLRALTTAYGQPMLKDAKEKLACGLISERTYQVIATGLS